VVAYDFAVVRKGINDAFKIRSIVKAEEEEEAAKRQQQRESSAN
jgi:hypothetical protein